MKVLLIKDVYKLGHTGDVKKVADGYGRNYLLTQGLAVLATPGALKSVEKIRAKAAVTRATLNQEMGGLAELIDGLELVFTSKAGETGKLYGSITTQLIADAINKKLGTQVDRRQVEAEPIRILGEHSAHVRLTIDLTPKVKIIVYREGEAPVEAVEPAKVESPVAEIPEPAKVESPAAEIPEPAKVESPLAETPGEEPVVEEKAE
jgi:large subunit ribosomal protein L9